MQVKKQQLEHIKHGTMDWFKLGSSTQGSIWSPGLFNFYAEYIMQNAKLPETQAGIKIAGRNINNLRYAGNTTLMSERRHTRPFRTNTQKRCPFHYRGLECKVKKHLE